MKIGTPSGGGSSPTSPPPASGTRAAASGELAADSTIVVVAGAGSDSPQANGAESSPPSSSRPAAALDDVAGGVADGESARGSESAVARTSTGGDGPGRGGFGRRLDPSPPAAAVTPPPGADPLPAPANGGAPTAGEVVTDARGRAGLDLPRVGAAASSAHPPLSARPNNSGFGPTLLGTSIFFVSLATAVTVALYVVEAPGMSTVAPRTAAVAPLGASAVVPAWWTDWKHIVAPAVGTLGTLIVACLFAWRNRKFTEPDRVDPRAYGELRDRLATLDARLPVLCPPSGPAICDHSPTLACVAGCDEAWARRDFVNAELSSRGSRWVLGSGYLDLWRHLHAAEEALFVVEAPEDLVGDAFYDELRLEGAGDEIDQWQTLQAKLRRAVGVVTGASGRFVDLSATDAAADGAAAEASTAAERALGRVVVRDIRRTINGFRDGERANLVRARNQLIWTGTFTAQAGYALLTLAVLAQAPAAAIVGGVVYFLVGAVVGLFNQLRNDANLAEAKDDFGFSRARLFYTPVLSGLAAVGGVLVVALLGDAVDFGALGAGGDGGGQDVARALPDIFDVHQFGTGLLIAAVFGLTPDLLVNRLQQQADRYQAGLQNTTAAVGGGTTTKSWGKTWGRRSL